MNLDVWPGALIKLYLGQVGPEDFLKAFKKQMNAMSPEYLCEGFYYLGQYFLLTGNKKLAADSFQQAVNSKAKQNIEYEFSLAYLARLRQQVRWQFADLLSENLFPLKCKRGAE